MAEAKKLTLLEALNKLGISGRNRRVSEKKYLDMKSMSETQWIKFFEKKGYK